MRLGEVYLWETDRAQGRDTRRKYHVFIGDDVDGNKVFLFINTADWYNDYKITQANYSFLTYDSFVGCSAAVTYTAAEITAASPNLVGELGKADLKGLRDAIIAAETMEQRDASFVCGSLAAAL
jgi:hypothetical protein